MRNYNGCNLHIRKLIKDNNSFSPYIRTFLCLLNIVDLILAITPGKVSQTGYPEKYLKEEVVCVGKTLVISAMNWLCNFILFLALLHV